MNQERYAAKWRVIKLLSGGGLLSDNGAHYADMMVHMFGEVDQAYCRTFNYEIPDAPEADALVKYDDVLSGAVSAYQGPVDECWKIRSFQPQAVRLSRN